MSRAEETFLSPEFQENIEEYFVNNIKSDVQAPLNRQIIKSSETIMYIVKLMNNFFDYFMGGAGAALADGFGNGLDNTDNMPRSGLEVGGLDVMQVLDFMRTLSNQPDDPPVLTEDVRVLCLTTSDHKAPRTLD